MRKFDATRLYLYLGFVTSMLFSMIFVVTRTMGHRGRLSGLQLVLVGTTVEVTILLFEVPTGVVADATRGGFRSSSDTSSWAGFCYRGLFRHHTDRDRAYSGAWVTPSPVAAARLSDEIGEENANRAFLHANRYELAGALVDVLLAIPLGTSP
jgi:DHA3 family tetracycline resistance protein-like MFS transporter